MGIGNMNYSVVSKADANRRVISEERTSTNGVYWNENYEYGTNGKLSKLTRKQRMGATTAEVVGTETYKYNTKNMISEIVSESVSTAGKDIEKTIHTYDNRDRITRVDYYTGNDQNSLKQTAYAIYYYKGASSIEEIANSGITVYPNPTSSELHVESHIAGIGNIEIFDVTGKSVATVKKGNLPTTTLNISHLPAGVYFLQIQTGTGVVTKKVVKQ